MDVCRAARQTQPGGRAAGSLPVAGDTAKNGRPEVKHYEVILRESRKGGNFCLLEVITNLNLWARYISSRECYSMHCLF